jgi:hypothetical protein
MERVSHEAMESRRLEVEVLSQDISYIWAR